MAPPHRASLPEGRPDGRPEDPPSFCMKSHRHVERIALCERHPVDQPFPICEGHRDRFFPEVMAPEIAILFGVCESCEKILRDTNASEQQRCQCWKEAVRLCFDSRRCPDCARYSAGKIKAISTGIKCEECFPPFADWYHADFTLSHTEYKLWEEKYLSGPCSKRHQPLTEERNKSCQVCKCLLPKERHLALCRRVEGTGFWSLGIWHPIMDKMFLWCGMEGCGKLLNNPPARESSAQGTIYV